MFCCAYDPEMARLFAEPDTAPDQPQRGFGAACVVLVLSGIGVAGLALAWP